MSYGSRIIDAEHEVAVYAARILRGAKPSDLPVLQPTRFEFIVNIKAAKSLGISVPPTLLARADEVFE
jgi:putative ABC transport system substrate-binding protein